MPHIDQELTSPQTRFSPCDLSTRQLIASPTRIATLDGLRRDIQLAAA